MTYSQAVSYLRQTNRAFCKPGIERVQTLASAFGDPHKDLSVIHVTGTNGKGSFCVLTEQMLVSAGNLHPGSWWSRGAAERTPWARPTGARSLQHRPL